jgi:hypothetical protein
LRLLVHLRELRAQPLDRGAPRSGIFRQRRELRLSVLDFARKVVAHGEQCGPLAELLLQLLFDLHEIALTRQHTQLPAPRFRLEVVDGVARLD